MKPFLSKLGRRQRPSDISRLMAIALERPDMLSLAAGFTDNASLPLDQVREIVDSFASDKATPSKTVLQYGTNQGREKLRDSLVSRIEKMDAFDEGALDRSGLMITNGSQQQLYLAVQTLCDPGDMIFVEQPTYFVFLEMLDGLGVEARPMPMLANGDVDAAGLESEIKSMKVDGAYDRLKAVYLVSYYANPSGHTISAEAKRGVAKVLSEIASNVALIEDAAYRELYFEIPSKTPGILRLEEAQSLPLLYTSTLTKPFASGLKVGYGYCSDENWRNAMLSVKGQQDFGTSHFSQAIVERAIETGIYDRHLEILRSMYQAKMKRLNEALGERLKKLGWEWADPDGGMYFWAHAPDGLRTDYDSEFHAACTEEGVMYVPGDLCHAKREPKDFARISYGVLDELELEKAADRFVSAAEKCCSAHRR